LLYQQIKEREGGNVVNTLEAIKNRTSFRGKYKDVAVPREDLIKIMEAGLLAPSGCNAQTTSLIAVDDPVVMEKLDKAMKSCGLKKNLGQAIICVLTQDVVVYKGRSFNVQDYSAAIQNMLLAIVALGYQSCWYEGEITDEDMIGRKMADILGVPNDYELICFLPVGVAEDAVRHAGRKPFNERAWFNGFRKD
jgi:nitroreductase